MINAEVLATIAAITVGFGVSLLFFRIGRELDMQEKDEPIWLPWSDRLLLAATLLSATLVLLPMVLLPESELFGEQVPVAFCAASLVCLAGYIPAVLAHYRIWFGRSRTGPRDNPEPSERLVVLCTCAAAVAALFVSFFTNDSPQ